VNKKETSEEGREKEKSEKTLREIAMYKGNKHKYW
jgi:hypothetical protein